MSFPIVAYIRTSTAFQDNSIRDQTTAIERFAASKGLVILDRYLDVASGRGRRALARPGLERAVAHAYRTGAPLTVARLDRLSRDGSYLAGLVTLGISFLSADGAEVPAFVFKLLPTLSLEDWRWRQREGIARAKAAGALERPVGIEQGMISRETAPPDVALGPDTPLTLRFSEDFV